MRSTGAHVLIVDDEPDMLMLLRLLLEGEGLRTSLAGDGATALQRIREERPDLIVLDVMMPVLDGWGVLENVRLSPDPPRVILLTAKSTERDHERARRLGADAYVHKPFDPDKLVEIVHMLLATERPTPTDATPAGPPPAGPPPAAAPSSVSPASAPVAPVPPTPPTPPLPPYVELGDQPGAG